MLLKNKSLSKSQRATFYFESSLVSFPKILLNAICSYSIGLSQACCNFGRIGFWKLAADGRLPAPAWASGPGLPSLLQIPERESRTRSNEAGSLHHLPSSSSSSMPRNCSSAVSSSPRFPASEPLGRAGFRSPLDFISHFQISRQMCDFAISWKALFGWVGNIGPLLTKLEIERTSRHKSKDHCPT